MLAKRACLLLFLALVAFYFYGLGHLPLLGADEPRYAQVAREMLLRRDLITPTLGGHVWFEKPALLYWMMIASYRLFGISEWSARVGPTLSGLFTVVSIYWLAKRAENASRDNELVGLAALSALVTLSTAGIMVFSRAASFDIVVTMTVTWSLSFFFVYELDPQSASRNLHLAGFYACIGLSLLAKGLIGVVLPCGVVFTYYLLRREWGSRFFRTLAWGLPLAAGVSAIWYGPVIVRNGSAFLNAFFIQHHFARYLSDRYHHAQPVYFYALVLVTLTLPWSGIFFEALAQAKKWNWHSEEVTSKLSVFLFSWLLFPFLFFSFSKSKLPGYIVPILPAAAVLTAARLIKLATGSVRERWLRRATGGLLLVLAVVGLVYGRRGELVTFKCMAIMITPLAAAGVVAMFRGISKELFVRVTVCAALFSAAITLNCGLHGIAQRESARDLISLADAAGYSNAPVYGLHKVDRSAEFYAAGRVAYGADGEPTRFEGVSQVQELLSQTRGPVLLIVPLEHADQLRGLRSAKVEVIGDNGEIALIAIKPENVLP